MKNLNKTDEMEEISLMELTKKILKFALKYKKIIGAAAMSGALIGGLIGLKLDKDNGYYKQEIIFNDSDIARGKNLDGTNFEPNFLIKGAENLEVSGKYPTYVVVTKKGFQSGEEREKLEKIIIKNKEEYIEKYFTADKFNREFDEKEQERIKKHDYKDFYSIINWYMSVFNKEFYKSKIYSDSGIEYKNIEKRIVENLLRYKTEIDKGNFSRNSESAKQYYETRIANIEKDKKMKKERFNSLDFVLGTLGEKNIKIESKVEITKGLTYEKAVSEYAQLLWNIENNEQSILKLKEEYRGVKFPSPEVALQLKKLEDDILEDMGLLVKEANSLMKKIIKYEKKVNLIKEAPVELIREKKIELLTLLGIVLGGILGFLIGEYKEWMISKKKN